MNYFFIEGKTRNFLYIQLGKRLELPATWDMCVWQNKSAELCKGKMQSPALNFCA